MTQQASNGTQYRSAVVITPSRTVTESDILRYAGFSGDFAPIHMNEEYARQSPYGTRILHGVGTLAICSGLVVQAGVFDGHLAFLGLELRLPRAVKPGDTLHVVVEETSRRT